MLNISYLCTRLTHIGVQWCNGSTTGFGSVCGGSPWTTFTEKRVVQSTLFS